MLIFPLLRGSHWAIHKVPMWSTIVERSTSGGSLAIPLWPNNPLWSWEWTYEAVIDRKLSFTGAPNSNTLYTDLQIIEAFYSALKGRGVQFLYQPSDSVVVGQLIAPPDGNNHSELVHTVGGYPTGAGMTAVNESVQELNGGVVTQISGGGAFTLLGANTTPPYEGMVMNWTSPPTPPIHVNFTYFYRVIFSEDTQDYEQFSYDLWQLQSLKFEQVRITTT